MQEKQCESTNEQRRSWNFTRVIYLCGYASAHLLNLHCCCCCSFSCSSNCSGCCCYWHRRAIESSKSGSKPRFEAHLTSTCASRHNGAGHRIVQKWSIHFFTSQLPKVARTCGNSSIFTSKCASHHNCVHFFHIATSKKSSEADMFWH